MWVGFDQNPLYALLHESIYCEVTFYTFFLICLAGTTLFLKSSVLHGSRDLHQNGQPIRFSMKMEVCLILLRLQKKAVLCFLLERYVQIFMGSVIHYSHVPTKFELYHALRVDFVIFWSVWQVCSNL